MIDVEKVAVEVQVLSQAHLDGGIGWLRRNGAGREDHLGEDGEGRQSDLGETLGGEFGLVDDDLLDCGVGRLRPMRLDWSHGDGVLGWLSLCDSFCC